MPNHPKSEIRKGQILRAAEKVFARKGYQEATISDVARQAKVSDATIYEYFPSKEELLFSIPGETARRARESMEDILKYIKGTTNKLRAIIYQYLWFYENNPDYSAVVLLILKQNRKFLEVAAYEDVRALARFLLDIIKEGIAAGEFRKDINPFLVRSIILGTIEHLVIRRVLLGGPESLVELVDPLIDLIVSGIDARKDEKIWNLRISLEQDEKMEKGKSLSEPEKKRIHPGRQR